MGGGASRHSNSTGPGRSPQVPHGRRTSDVLGPPAQSTPTSGHGQASLATGGVPAEGPREARGAQHDGDLQADQEQIRRLGPWLHNIRLPSGAQTAPRHPLGDWPRRMWDGFCHAVPEDLSGWRVLDIGCNAGFYSFQLARRGAHVTAIDIDPRYLAQAHWIASRIGLEDQVRFRRMQVYDLADHDEAYDMVLLLGVFYHLRHPLLGLDLAASRTRRMLFFQSLRLPGPAGPVTGAQDVQDLLQDGWPQMAFIKDELMSDRTNWWVPNAAAMQAMAESAGMRPRWAGTEVLLCEPQGALPDLVREEMLRATGSRSPESMDRFRPEPGTLESRAGHDP